MLRWSIASAAFAPRIATARQPEATPSARSGAANEPPPILVDAAWLATAADRGDASLVILDLGDWDDYRAGHIPGAVHSYWQETIERDYPVYGTVLNQLSESLEENQGKRLAWLKRYGIAPGTQVIAYDHGDGRRAARIVWFLHFLGHHEASALNGGIDAWRADGFETTTRGSDPRVPATDPVADPQSGFYLATDQLVDALAEPNTRLVDIRSDAERRDSVDGQFPLGLIPGSIWAPWPEFVIDDSGRFLPDDDARAKLQALDLAPDRRIVLYGRFGTDADQMWLLLKHLGYPSVEIYDRGWAEWSTTSGRPSEPLP